MDRATGRSKGFGFVEMANAADAATAIDELNDKEFLGRRITVNEAKPFEKRSERADRPNRDRASGNNRRQDHGRRY